MATKKSKKNIYEKFGPAMVILLVVMAFAVGSLWQQVKYLEKGTPSGGNNVVNNAPAPTPDITEPLGDSLASSVVGVSADDHIKGSSNAEVVIIEYSDLECPFCSQFHPTVERALEDYGDDVAWVYRHFPLSFHPQAVPAAIAAECVADIGGNDAFWNYLDEIFSDQQGTLSDLTGTASLVGVNSQAVQTCIDSDKFADKVDSQYSAGVDAGVNGTPGTFIVNKDGKVWSLPGAVPYNMLQEVLDVALAS